MRFTKMSGAGNDFVLIEKSLLSTSARKRLSQVAARLCDRRKSIGADGLLVLEKGRAGRAGSLDYYNSDGSRAFCGNGSRCAALWMHREGWTRAKSFEFDSIEGVLEARIVGGGRVTVKMPDARDYKPRVRLSAAGKSWILCSVNTGVPHAVVVVSDLARAPVYEAGKAIRRHRAFAPAGTNVNFISMDNAKKEVAIRTYERGVEDETLACGTGVVASAVAAHCLKGFKPPIRVRTRGGDLLTVRFDSGPEGFRNVWLEGPAAVTFEGRISL